MKKQTPQSFLNLQLIIKAERLFFVRKGERTKHMIIEKAASLFNQRGYVASSMVDVMNETGLERGGLYNHFRSKDELAIQAFNHAVETMRAKFRDALTGKKPIANRLLAFLDVFSQLYEDTPIPGGCPIMNVAIETDTAHPLLKEQAKQAMAELHQFIERVVLKAIERGEVSSRIKADEVATLFLSSMEGALMLSRLHEDKKYLSQTVAFLQDYIQKQLTVTTA